MRKTIMVFGLFCWSYNSIAQTQNTVLTTDNSKVTATSSRLVASGVSVFSGTAMVLNDSTHLTYSNNMGWDSVLKSWRYDRADIYEYDSDKNIYTKYYKITRSFNSLDMINKTVGEVWDTANKVWHVEVNDSLFYTTNGLISTTSTARFNGTSWDSIKTTNTYNSFGELTTSLGRQWNLTTSIWEDTERSTYNYSGNNLIEQIEETFTNGNWVNDKKLEYTYDANGNINVVEIKKWASQSWSPHLKFTHAYNSLNEQTTTLLQAYNGSQFINQHETVRTFNSFNQKITEVRKSWDVNTNQFIYSMGDFYERFYYEAYTTGINVLFDSEYNKLNIYPVPASDVIYVNNSGTVPMHVVLYDMNGNSFSDIVVNKGNTKDINVSSVATGTYILSIYYSGKKITRMINILQ